MTKPAYSAVATRDYGEDKLVRVMDHEFVELRDAVAWVAGIAKTHGVAGDGAVSYLEITAIDPDENLYIFCSTDPSELDALMNEHSLV